MSDLDLGALESWMSQTTPHLGAPVQAEKFAGGQSNPTYRLRTQNGAAVLRRKPFGSILPSAHAVEREYRLMEALHPTGFPVPQPYALCEDAGVIGSPFYLMVMAEGRNIADGGLPGVSPPNRRAMYDAMIDTLAALHSIDPQAVGLGEFGKPGNYFARQVERWTKQYRAAQTDRIKEVECLVAWLPTTVPVQDRVSIIHGDYRIDNVIFAESAPEVVAVIDWELSTLGDPLADFAYLAMNWILPSDGRAGLAGLDLDALGIPTLEVATERYCAATGRASLPDLHWYFAYNLFRLVGILQGVKKRLEQGNASGANAALMVAKIEPLAREAAAQMERAQARGKRR